MQNVGTAAERAAARPLRVIAVAPTYNEAANVPTLVEKLLALQPPIDVLIVDDDSPDGTTRIVEEIGKDEPRVHVINRRGLQRGYSPSCVDGLSWALENGYDVAITMDADLSHDPAVIPSMLARIDSGADLVVGSRYVDGGDLVVEWGPVRTAVSKLGSAYARTMVGTRVRDCTSGYRCYRREALEKVPLRELRSDGYSFIIEVLSKLTKEGARVEEVPITYVDRRAGESKISRSIVIEALIRTTGIGLARIVGR